MTPKDEKSATANLNETPHVRLRQPTCPECGSDVIFRGFPGYVCRNFIKAVACGPERAQGTGESTPAVPGSRIVYERLSDGSLNVDYDEDRYDRLRYEDDEFFACAECEQVLQFENGREVRDEEQFVEWVRLNSGESGEGRHEEQRFRCEACGHETFFISQKNVEAQHPDENPIYVCTRCGCEFKD
jgi:DNA-directed RNA polymerase subunit M/transcription elongation factor TFIIS